MSDLIAEVEIEDAGTRVFDRIPSENPKRLNHKLSALLGPSTEIAPIRSYSWAYVQLDQGREGACTGFSATMEAAARPKPVFGDPRRKPPVVADLNAQAQRVYYRARQLDVWPGENYEGSSVDGACLAGRELGWWDAWVWATGSGEAMARQIMQAIATKGPVMVGSWWRRGMKPDAEGFMSYSGDKLGGHAYLYTRVRMPHARPRSAAARRFAERAPNGAVWTPNSWGGAGQGWLTFEDLAASMADGGDAALVANRL